MKEEYKIIFFDMIPSLLIATAGFCIMACAYFFLPSYVASCSLHEVKMIEPSDVPNYYQMNINNAYTKANTQLAKTMNKVNDISHKYFNFWYQCIAAIGIALSCYFIFDRNPKAFRLSCLVTWCIILSACTTYLAVYWYHGACVWV